MRKSWIILLFFFFVIGCSKRGEYNLLKWKVGQWVSYKINDKPIRVSIVGKDSVFFWVETVEPELTAKVLVEEAQLDEAIRLIVKKVNETPFEIQVDKFSIKSGFPNITVEESGKKEIVVLPSGKFKAFHVKQEEEDVWLANKVPIFGIVKYKSKDKEIILWDYGLKGAKSEIKENVNAINLEEAS